MSSSFAAQLLYEPIRARLSPPAICSNLEGTNPRPQLPATPLGAACGTWLASEPNALPKLLMDPIRCPSRKQCSDGSHTSPHAPLGPKPPR